jgi:P pilus assembly chaperone PapD
MKHLIKIFSILWLSSLSPNIIRAADPPGQIAVSPAMFELKIGPQPVNESIRIKNLKKYPITLKVEVYNWALDEKNEVKILPPNIQSIDQWMVINPLSFTVEPGKEQVIRFSVRPRVTPTPGEHRAVIYFLEQPSSATPGGVEVLFKLGVGIYGYTDPVTHATVLHNLTIDRAARKLHVDLQNNGNVHTRLKGDYAIWKKGTFPGFKSMSNYLNWPIDKKKPEGFIAVGTMNNTPVLAGSRRTITTSIPLPDSKSGDFTVAVEGTIDDKRIEKIFP